MEQFKNVLPEDFEGVFYFTNASDEDFTARWNGIAYTFPAKKTSPMIISGATPEEVQNIRKKFATEYAEREWYKSPKLKAREDETPKGSVGSFRMASTYTESDLATWIQQCLEPLPAGQVTRAKVEKKKMEDMLHTDDDGEPVTQVVTNSKKSLFKDKAERMG